MDKFFKNIKIYLVFIVIFQLVVLTWEYLGAIYPVWSGTEIYLKTVPVDPRDMFRGNYARLSYDISTIPVNDFANMTAKIRNEEIVYVKLVKKGDFYEYDGSSFQKPETGIFLRGRINQKYISSYDKNVSVKYGIEAFFAKKEKAQKLESELSSSAAMAIVKVASNGKAALIDVRKYK